MSKKDTTVTQKVSLSLTMTTILLVITIGAAITASAGNEDSYSYIYLPFINRSNTQLLNGGFEAGEWQESRHWIWPWRTVYLDQYQEIRPGEEWTAWWVEYRPCPGFKPHRSGRPEVTVISLSDGFPDPVRIKEGNKALKWFSFYRCHIGGVYQKVNLSSGTYQVSLFAHHWYSNCDTRPHDPPYESDCITRADWTDAFISVGIDLFGGEDWRSAFIVWSEPVSVYGKYSDNPILSPEIVVPGGSVTIWIKSETEAPLKHEDLYVDQIVLNQLTGRH